MHMLLIPGAMFGLIRLHLYLVVRLGVSPPWSKEAAARSASAKPVERRAPGSTRPRAERYSVVAVRSTSAARGSSATRRTSTERGKPFFPFAMFHDTVMSLVVVLVIIGLACIWK